MSEFEVGNLVQLIDEDDNLHDGEVLSVEPAKRERPSRYWECTEEEQDEMVARVTVKWDDGTESVVKEDELSEQDSELERQFRTEADEVLEKIQKKLAKASQLLTEAEELSEAHGIPFSSGISPLSQDYTPASFSSKWEEISKDFAQSITDAYPGGEYDNEGWEHSAVC